MGHNAKTIGIIGGMGPAATVAFMNRILLATPADDDSDHFRMIVDNNPKVPSRIAAIIEKTGPDPLPELTRMALGLEEAGADFLVMPCNTAHHYHARIAEAVTIPFISMIDATAAYLAAHFPHARRIGLLASPAVQTTQVFHDRFAREGLDVVYPDGLRSAQLLAVIREVKCGMSGPAQITAYHDVAAGFAEIIDVMLVACTELSILSLPDKAGVAVLDTLDILVRATIDHASAS